MKWSLIIRDQTPCYLSDIKAERLITDCNPEKIVTRPITAFDLWKLDLPFAASTDEVGRTAWTQMNMSTVVLLNPSKKSYSFHKTSQSLFGNMKCFLIFIQLNSVTLRGSQLTKVQWDQTCNYISITGLLEWLENSISLHAVKQNEINQMMIIISYYMWHIELTFQISATATAQRCSQDFQKIIQDPGGSHPLIYFFFTINFFKISTL